MARGGRGRQFTLRLVLVVVALFGVACLVAAAAFVRSSAGDALLDDTRAYLGVGVAEGVPTVSQVDCINTNQARFSRTRDGSNRGWQCRLALASAEPPPAAATVPPSPAVEEPGRPLSYAEQMQRYEVEMARYRATTARQSADLNRQLAELASPSRTPGELERELPINRTGQIPTLRRLSAEGEPARYGVIWGAGDLMLRWLSVGMLALVIVALGAACLFAAQFGWRRTRR